MSEGTAACVEVVRTLDAPCLSSSSISAVQCFRNLANVFSGCTRAKHATSCPKARTAFDLAFVVA